MERPALPGPGPDPLLTRKRGSSRARPRKAAPRTGEVPLRGWYDALFRAYGPQGWWPGRSRFEVIVGAYLTQNVAWSNVARALRNLRKARLLHPVRLRRARAGVVAKLIRPSGYYNQKADRLLAFVRFLETRHGGSLDRLFRQPLQIVRRELLGLRGVGPETADSILLYAGKRPVFVIDAYTRRLLHRHGYPGRDASYEDLRRGFETALPADVNLFNEFHALIVRLAKEQCRSGIPDCRGCPLEPFLPPSGPRRD
ncbi:MAG TPA: endonuclease III domain-containing protein [Candidatus Polarisedimenticolia bacterium]|nr:endonuclease III domain-containing protein [Candidatus Polarisedimenticolia bacterium]